MEKFDMAVVSGAEAIILDWEKTVAPPYKQAARKAVVDWLLQATPRLPIWVRINARDSIWWKEDLDWLVRAPADRIAGVVLPKTRYPSDIVDTHACLKPDLGIVASIECAESVHNAPVLASTPGVVTLALGGTSFQIDVGLGDDDHAWIYPRSRLVFACRAANLDAPIDRADMRVDDPRGTGRSARAASSIGMGAKLCVHPSQIPLVNAAFGYNDNQRAWALRVLAAAKQCGGTAVWVDGELVDGTRVDLARQIVTLTS